MVDTQAAIELQASAGANSNGRTLLLALLTAMAVGGVFLFLEPAGAPIGKPPEARSMEKELLGSDTGCHQKLGETPQHRAVAALSAARSKKQREPFAPADGVQAVALMAEAAACFASAGDSEQGRLLSAQADAWHAAIWSAFQGHQLRWELALENEQLDDGLAELKSLKALWGTKGGAFAEWLRVSEVEAERKLAKARKR